MKNQVLRYFIELAYHGKNYHGWQIQPTVNSVQQELNTAISTILQQEINIVGAGRTDAGVHASQMIAHFDSETVLVNDISFRLNSILPDDIVVSAIYEVTDAAHARFDAISRSYEYRIWLGRNPFLLDTTWQLHHQKLNVLKMNNAAKILYKYKDFECFSKVKTDVHTFNCDILHAEWIQNGNELTFHISANRFLRNMVRAIVGTLLEVGLGKMTLQEFENVIKSKNRSNAGVSVPARGLFLTDIQYPKLK